MAAVLTRTSCATWSPAAAQAPSLRTGSAAAPPLRLSSSRSASISGRTFAPLSAARQVASARRGRGAVVRAVVAPPTSSPTPTPSTDVSLPEELDGFVQIGEQVPAGIALSEVIRTMPREVFEISEWKSWRSVLITVTAVAAGYAALAVSPWWLYPLVYAYLGTAVTGLFVVGHDCGHNSFSNYQIVNDVVGTVMLAPLIFPFEPWRIKHNTHHGHTNKLVIDTAWQPFRPKDFDSSGPVAKFLITAMMGPFWWLASIGHWLVWHFDLSKFKQSERPKVIVSLAAVSAFAAGVLAPLLVLGGPVAFVKWWLIPFLGFHFWMSTFTLVHHTAPHIPFKHAREWDATQAQLGGTIHCDYPAWVEFLCHDISVHVPHHLSSKIPSYNLRPAYAAVQQHWDKYINKAEFGVPLMRLIVSQCNLFDPDQKKWVKFNERA